MLKCLDCSKILTGHGNPIRCKSCAFKKINRSKKYLKLIKLKASEWKRTKEMKKKISKSILKLWKTKKYIKLQNIARAKKNSNYKKKISKTLEKLWRQPEYRAKMLTQDKFKKIIKSLHKSPNKPEQQLITLIKQHNLPFKFVGNGSFFIENFNPDFINKKGRQIIEIYGDYWHNTTQNKIRNLKRKKVYKKKHWKLLIIWEKEFINQNKILTKIINFIGGKK